MWTDRTFRPIHDNDAVVAEDGTQYPCDFPKEEIVGLTRVIETPTPDDPTKIVMGFSIDETYTQVWRTRDKTAEERAAERKDEALSALASSDKVIIRCLEAGVVVSTEWRTYRAALRSVVSGELNAIPAKPSTYPDQTEGA